MENQRMTIQKNTLRPLQGDGRKLFVETYGCQMNVGDTEIVVSVMQAEGYVYTDRIDEADIILINTCSIRDNAEQRIWGRLAEMKRLRKAKPALLVGVIGCMAERLKEKLFEGLTASISSPAPMPTATCRVWCAKPKRGTRGSTCFCRPKKPTPKSLPCGSTATA